MSEIDDLNRPASPEPNVDALRSAWEKPVLLPLSVDQSEGDLADFTGEVDFKTPS